MTFNLFELLFVIFILFRSSRFHACRFKGGDFFLEIEVGGLIDGEDRFPLLIRLADEKMSDSESKDSSSLFPVHITAQCAGAGDFTIIRGELTKIRANRPSRTWPSLHAPIRTIKNLNGEGKVTGKTADPDTFGSNASQGVNRILQVIVIDNKQSIPKLWYRYLRFHSTKYNNVRG